MSTWLLQQNAGSPHLCPSLQPRRAAAHDGGGRGKKADHLWMQMGICGRCTSHSHRVSRDAQNMSSKLTNQAGEGTIRPFGCVVLQAHPSNCAARGGRRALRQPSLPAAAWQPGTGSAFTCGLSSNLPRAAGVLWPFKMCCKTSLLFLFIWVGSSGDGARSLTTVVRSQMWFHY